MGLPPGDLRLGRLGAASRRRPGSASVSVDEFRDGVEETSSSVPPPPCASSSPRRQSWRRRCRFALPFSPIACDRRPSLRGRHRRRRAHFRSLTREPRARAHRASPRRRSRIQRQRLRPAATASSRRSTASLLPPGFTPSRDTPVATLQRQRFCAHDVVSRVHARQFPFAFVMRDPTAAAPRPGASALNRFAPSCCAARFSFHVRRARRSHGAFHPLA